MKINYKYIPCFFYHSIFNIPYDYFISQGIKSFFFDLDNTLLRYDEVQLNEKTKSLLTNISKICSIVILSNASQKKLKKILYPDFNYIHLNLVQKKPNISGFKKALNFTHRKYNEVVMIGDQLKTDIAGSNLMNIISILVKPLDREKESLFTKLNRFWFEKSFIQKVKQINPIIYEKKFKFF